MSKQKELFMGLVRAALRSASTEDLLTELWMRQGQDKDSAGGVGDAPYFKVGGTD
ncbi:MAG: hypothetical protein ACREAZ_09525 [Nitrososphaera sp.]